MGLPIHNTFTDTVSYSHLSEVEPEEGDKTVSMFKHIIDVYAGEVMQTIRQRDKMVAVNELFTGLRRGSIPVEVFREEMSSLGYTDDGIKEMLNLAVELRDRERVNIREGPEIGISGEQYRAVEQQVQENRASASATDYNNLMGRVWGDHARSIVGDPEDFDISEINKKRQGQEQDTATVHADASPRSKTRAECIRVKEPGEERVVDNSERERRRKETV